MSKRIAELRSEIEQVTATIRTTAGRFRDNGDKWPS